MLCALQVYDDLDVNNIEDSNEEAEISHWCPMDAPDMPEGCTETFTVPTYNCLGKMALCVGGLHVCRVRCGTKLPNM